MLLRAARRSVEQFERIWGGLESSERDRDISQHTEALRALCSSSGCCRAAQRSLEEQSGVIRRRSRSREGILQVRALWGGLQGLGGGGGMLRGAWSSLAEWFRAFKGFLERFRAAECSEGFSTV